MNDEDKIQDAENRLSQPKCPVCQRDILLRHDPNRIDGHKTWFIVGHVLPSNRICRASGSLYDFGGQLP